ncbi:uncharacterized protein LOC122673188 [Cervus elaphus]|uniref:uncharacterized protein LOC122673188 n=1 Tax=Cervus elaphus TaxID=9860 RepID=UPI001CC2AFB2|nr:uncharacterized protein LOC122673188 [Cervus elaphus]
MHTPTRPHSGSAPSAGVNLCGACLVLPKYSVPAQSKSEKVFPRSQVPVRSRLRGLRSGGHRRSKPHPGVRQPLAWRKAKLRPCPPTQTHHSSRCRRRQCRRFHPSWHREPAAPLFTARRLSTTPHPKPPPVRPGARLLPWNQLFPTISDQAPEPHCPFLEQEALSA